MIRITRLALCGAGLVGLLIAQQAMPQSAPAPIAAPGTSASLGALAGYWREPRPAGRRGGGPPAAGPAGAPAAGGPPASGGVRISGPGARVRIAAEGHLLPWTAKRLKEYEDAMAAGGLPRTNANQCLPWAVPGIGIPGGIAYGMNIVTAPGEVAFMYELDHQARIVYLDQKHPANLKPSYFGHSVGHWDGRTLTVDSIGFNDKTEIHDGIAHTAALHVTEQLSINTSGQLEDHVTFDDPGAYSSPISFTDVFERGTAYQEYVCAENNQEAERPGK